MGWRSEWLSESDNHHDRLREVESNLISWALKVSAGNKSKAAELLNIKRSTLGDRIKKLGLGHLEAVEQ